MPELSSYFNYSEDKLPTLQYKEMNQEDATKRHPSCDEDHVIGTRSSAGRVRGDGRCYPRTFLESSSIRLKAGSSIPPGHQGNSFFVCFMRILLYNKPALEYVEDNSSRVVQYYSLNKDYRHYRYYRHYTGGGAAGSTWQT